MNRIDLHIHSCFSINGTYTPEELVSRCKTAGITVMAIADHNTTAGCLRGMTAAKNAGIRCIPAVELDCICTFQNRRTNLHILGYGIDPAYSGFLALEQRVRAQEQAASGLLLERAEGLGLALDREEVYALSHDGVVTGEIIATDRKC